MGSPTATDTSASLDELMAPVRRMLSQLLHSEALERGDVDAALVQLTEAAASALRVERASVWHFDGNRSGLVCLDLFEKGPGRHSSGTVLRAADTPAYFAALETERSIASHDARNDPRTREFDRSYLQPLGITSMLDAPVMLNGRLAGVVCHEHVGPLRRWEPWEELVAASFGDFVSMVLGAAERTTQARALRRYRDQLEELVNTRTRQLKESEARFAMLFEAAPVALVMSRRSDGCLMAANPRAAAMFGVSPDEVQQQRAPDFWVDNGERDALMKLLAEKGNVESFSTRLKSREGQVFWADVAARAVLVGEVAAAIFGIRDVSAQKEAEERLQKLATTDGLTGVLSRRRIFELAREELERAHRYQRPLVLAMLDLDHFKSVNDRFGHATGDDALRAVAEVLRADLRKEDKLGRYGGEEFMLVMPETSVERAAPALERARIAVERLELTAKGQRLNLTVSAGFVALQPELVFEDLIRRADEALFAAKRAGRNRVMQG
jgi:diguanylate cyclase (GGDEF)-like protein/PAS domain S-box-containing protein